MEMESTRKASWREGIREEESGHADWLWRLFICIRVKLCGKKELYG
jgi:hypothetical protein